MATKKPIPPPQGKVQVKSDVDIAYTTQQRAMFTSGLAATIGMNALGVWSAIKTHADFDTGECWPGIRHLMALTGLASDTVQAALKTLEAAHLLRVRKEGPRRNIYIARERMDIYIGNRIIAIAVVDYVPNVMRERLAGLKAAAQAGDMRDSDVWAQVELIPGPGMSYDASSGTFKDNMRADDVSSPSIKDLREKLRVEADNMRNKLLKK